MNLATVGAQTHQLKCHLKKVQLFNLVILHAGLPQFYFCFLPHRIYIEIILIIEKILWEVLSFFIFIFQMNSNQSFFWTYLMLIFKFY